MAGAAGTYMGEFFGVMLKEKITTFPFSHFNNPSTYADNSIVHRCPTLGAVFAVAAVSLP